MDAEAIAKELLADVESYLNGAMDLRTYTQKKAALWTEAHALKVAPKVRELVQARLKELDASR